jgi:RNA polymerase sigma-70 factor (ECF subfamily)
MKNYLRDWETQFITHRPYLVSFAFRMTGSLAEAEELVQETFIECANVDPQTILNHRSWLTKVCSNKSIDLMKSAHKRRETYIGPWLPDAVPDSFHYWGHSNESEAPDKALLLTESMSPTFLLIAEKLSPEERAVYLLNEVFDYSFAEIADFLNKSVATLRKTAQRARDAMNSERVRYDSLKPEAQNIVVKFFELAKKQDKSELLDLLSDGSEYWSDSGGKINAVRAVLRNKVQIAAFFSSQLMSSVFGSPELKIETGMVNGLPGLMISKKIEDGSWVFDTIMNFEILHGQIVKIYSQRNPDKLQPLLSLTSD